MNLTNGINNNKLQIDALKYALDICKFRAKAPLVNESFRAGCNEVALFIRAAVERLEKGESLRETISVDW